MKVFVEPAIEVEKIEILDVITSSWGLENVDPFG